MAKGENIFKRKDGRWEARYIKGYELSGKIKYGFCYGKTYREAKEKVTKCKAALVNGKSIPSTNSRHRFSFYCDEWLRMRKPKVKGSTYIKYDTALRKHIKPKLGGCFPMGMTTGLIDDFTEELLFEDELAPKTVHDVLVVLHGALFKKPPHQTGIFRGYIPQLIIETVEHDGGAGQIRFSADGHDCFLFVSHVQVKGRHLPHMRTAEAGLDERVQQAHGFGFLTGHGQQNRNIALIVFLIVRGELETRDRRIAVAFEPDPARDFPVREDDVDVACDVYREVFHDTFLSQRSF